MDTYDIAAIIGYWQHKYPEHQPKECDCTTGGRCGSIEAFSRTVGVSHSTMHRRLTDGRLTYEEADAWACRIGALPWLIWPEFRRVARDTCPAIAAERQLLARLSGNCGLLNDLWVTSYRQRWNGSYVQERLEFVGVGA